MSDFAQHSIAKLRWLVGAGRGTVDKHAAAAALAILSALGSTAEPLLMRRLVDEAVHPDSVKVFFYLPLLFTALIIGRHFLQCYASHLTLGAVLLSTLKLRRRLLQRLLAVSPEFITRFRSGDFVYRLERNVDQIASIAGEFLSMLVQTALVLMLISASMFRLDWKLACIVLPLVPCSLVVRWRYRTLLNEALESVLGKAQDLSGFLEEQLAALQQIQLLRSENRSVQGLVSRSANVVRSQIRLRRIEIGLHMWTITVTAVGSGLILGLGSWQVNAGVVTIGTLVAFYGYLTRLLDPLGMAVDAYAHVQRMFVNIGHLQEIEQASPLMADRPGAKTLPRAVTGSIRLEQLHFSYQPGQPVLRDCSLVLDPGVPLALVGASGSGKSTVARLLVRFYEPSSGSIELDGINISEIKLASLREAIALMPQDPVLFRLTIRENLLLACPSASLHNIYHALAMTQCEEFLSRMPHGIDSDVGPRGCQLSMCERQRLALARRVLRAPRRQNRASNSEKPRLLSPQPIRPGHLAPNRTGRLVPPSGRSQKRFRRPSGTPQRIVPRRPILCRLARALARHLCGTPRFTLRDRPECVPRLKWKTGLRLSRCSSLLSPELCSSQPRSARPSRSTSFSSA